MDHEDSHASLDHRRGEALQVGVFVLVIHADAAFHRYRHVDHLGHRTDAFADEFWFAHQAGAELTGLHPIRRTTHVEVDLIIAGLCTHHGSLGQLHGIATAQLQGHRMLFVAVLEQT